MSFIKVSIGGLFKTVGTANVFKVFKGGAWKDVQFVRVWKVINGQGSWKDVWVRAATAPAPAPAPVDVPPPAPPIALSVSIIPSDVFGTAYATGTVETNRDAIVSVSGGTGPYTYHWGLVNWSANTPPTVQASSEAATRFLQAMPLLNRTETATFSCLVVDSLGNQGSAQVNATWTTTQYVGAGASGYRSTEIAEDTDI